jgi:hypothetical protein
MIYGWRIGEVASDAFLFGVAVWYSVTLWVRSRRK